MTFFVQAVNPYCVFCHSINKLISVKFIIFTYYTCTYNVCILYS